MITRPNGLSPHYGYKWFGDVAGARGRGASPRGSRTGRPARRRQGGGSDGGGTRVTDIGQEVLDLYTAICDASAAARTDQFHTLLKHIRD